MKILFAVICLSISSINLFAQEGNWEVYLAQYEKGPGSTEVNMGIKNTAPDKNLPFLFSAGVNFTNCTPDGFPTSDEFGNLNGISDSITALVNSLTKNTVVGTFTYQCQRRDYFYVLDTSDLRPQVTKLIAKRFPGYSPAFNIKLDNNWETYLTFLYPSETIMDYIKNDKVISQLLKAGDKLDKPRKVDHWLYFKTNADRSRFIEYAIRQQYKIETKETIPDGAYLFKLHISRTDNVNLGSISKITLELERAANKNNGNYDGWETAVIK